MMDKKSMDDSSIWEPVKKRYISIRDSRAKAILRIQDVIVSSIREFLHERGFIEVQAPIIGPVTDPGIRGAKQVSFDFYGSQFKIMSSMILYKQMVVSSLGKIFSLSPNIRIEPIESQKTRRHLSEFRQIDIEMAVKSYEESMQLAEELIYHVCKEVKERCGRELKKLGRKLKIPIPPFERITFHEAIERIKSMGFEVDREKEISWDAEEVLSSTMQEPFFIIDYPKKARGFYYSEHEHKPGILRDFDLLFPEGYGEGISGGEREYRHEVVLTRLKESGEDPKQYRWYLDMLKYGIPQSVGFGIGLERLTRWICRLDEIWQATPFPKVPGVISP